MNKKLKIILISIAILIILLVILRVIIESQGEKTQVSDFSSIKQLVEYDGHTYIKEQQSQEEGFEKDIYIVFNSVPITENGITNQGLYEILISHIGEMIAGHNFRIIDEAKDIIVRIKYTDKEISSYTINNDNKYWDNLLANYQSNSYKDSNTTNFSINSQVLVNIINNNWEYDTLNLGTKDSHCGNYDIYFDEGYKVRTINTQIYNIVFTSNYKSNVINQISTNTSVEQVKSILGTPTFDEDTGVIGYKGTNIYIFFTDGEISIYPIDRYNESDSIKFGNLVTELNTTGDTNTFLNKLTDLYQDYETYYKTSSYVSLIYPLRGFSVTLGAVEGNGITIYSNFKGKITNDKSITDIINDKKAPNNVNLQLTYNLVMQSEEKRNEYEQAVRSPYEGMAEIETEKYNLIKDGDICSFYSTDKTQIDSELELTNLTNILNYGQTIFIYGIKNDGIYAYDASKMATQKLYGGQGKFNIKSIENNTIYYDNTSLQI